jgi:uncharacterized protein
MEHRLPQQKYMAYPFRIGADGAATSGRAAHVREQIEQVLLTIPGERVFRRDFGAGIRRLVFEPNILAIHAIASSRLRASLEEALRGEVDPTSLTIDVGPRPGDDAAMQVIIRYVLGATGEPDEVIIGPAGVL